MKLGPLVMTLAGLLGVTGCQTFHHQTVSARTDATTVSDGRSTTVRVQPIDSFKIEVAPRVAVCRNPAMNNQCLQYRQAHERNFHSLAVAIDGLNYEAGNRYFLDVKQEVVTAADGQPVTRWKLNRIIRAFQAPMGTNEPALR